MIWTQELRAFIAKHIDDDTDTLLLSAAKYPGIDVPAAVDQIEARRRLKNKLPEWYALSDNLIMGGRVPAEQCSSELAAKYKRGLVLGESICDMTGGMGVDLFYMSRGLKTAIYTERQSHLCENAKHNFSVLGADNIEVREGDGRDLAIPDVDTIYLDPARRAGDGSRVYEIADCEPNVVEWQGELMKHCKRLVTKHSPMVDVQRTLERLIGITDIHIVAVKGECKEVLVVQEASVVDSSSVLSSSATFATSLSSSVISPSLNGKNADVSIHCVDFVTEGVLEHHYHLGEEANANAEYCGEEVGAYLYEPDVTLMKAHAFRHLCGAYGVKKLDGDVHLYTSDVLVTDFPGRRFIVEEVMDFSSKLLKTIKRVIPQANITSRGFVLTADELRKRAGIKDGGSVYLFAGTVAGKKVLVKCRKA